MGSTNDFGCQEECEVTGLQTVARLVCSSSRFFSESPEAPLAGEMHHPADPADHFLCSSDLEVTDGSCLCNWISLTLIFISLLSSQFLLKASFALLCQEVHFPHLAGGDMHLSRLWTQSFGHSCPLAQEIHPHFQPGTLNLLFWWSSSPVPQIWSWTQSLCVPHDFSP